MSDSTRRPYSIKPNFLKAGDLDWWTGKSHFRDNTWKPFNRMSLTLRRMKGQIPHPIRSWKSFYTRGRVGYDISDTWGLDYYILSWLPEAIGDLRKGHGYPGNICTCPKPNGYCESENCDGAEQWDKVLEKIQSGLIAGRTLLEHPHWRLPLDKQLQAEESLNAEFVEGWELMGKWMFHLWD